MGASTAIDSAETMAKTPTLVSSMNSEYSAMASGNSNSTISRMPPTKNCAETPITSSKASDLANETSLVATASRRATNEAGRMHRHHGRNTAITTSWAATPSIRIALSSAAPSMNDSEPDAIAAITPITVPPKPATTT